MFPNTKWKKNNLGKGWVLGETLITGIGQGYTQTTPLQLCLMTAQIANGGYSIKPRIVVNNNPMSLEEAKSKLQEETLHGQEKNYLRIIKISKLFKRQCLVQLMNYMEHHINPE